MKKIKAALISVFYKEGLGEIAETLHQQGVTIYSTGGTREFIEQFNIPCVPIESLTGFPSILGGRVKTLHPLVFGGILGKRNDEVHLQEMKQYEIPEFDLVIVDLYPFEETVKNFEGNITEDESPIIEKIDIGGPSMIRAAAKNHQDVTVVASKNDYPLLQEILNNQQGQTTYEQRRYFAVKAFDVCSYYDNAISNYFNNASFITPFNKEKRILRYGENPHQSASFYGNLNEVFTQLNGKELSYNNLVDVDAAIQLIKEFEDTTFAIIKHTNVCGIAQGVTLKASWDKALAGDPESAFGGVLICNTAVDIETATAINELFFEVLIAPSFNDDALTILKSKKNRILLQLKNTLVSTSQYRSLLNGILLQENDNGNFTDWKEEGGRISNANEKEDLIFANLVCKHLKSNAIALIKNKQLIGKGCGQTSRVDALRHAIEKAHQFKFELNSAVLASDAFFPFDDCVKIAHAEGIIAFIQPGGSIRDADSINYSKENNLVMVITGQRHFKH
ncbi:MAG: bifunctional phosphoribosylaminoimidazolecarboxamide formyltransferase/IMP cyclohydrolase [Bacteroidota bacterium]